MAININHSINFIESSSDVTLKSTNGESITFNPSSGTINVSLARIGNLTDPSNAQDATTKNYVDNQISNLELLIDADSGATGSVNITQGTLTVNGTVYQIETVISGDTLTISLPTSLIVPGSLEVTTDLLVQNDVSVSNNLTVNGTTTLNYLTVQGTLNSDDITSTNITVAGDATITGNLTVQGTTTSVNSTNTQISDNIIVLNQGETGTGISGLTSGIEVDRGSLDNATWKYNETTNSWEAKEGSNLTTIAANELNVGDVNISNSTISVPNGNDLILQTSGDILINNQKVSTQDDAIAYAIVFGG